MILGWYLFLHLGNVGVWESKGVIDPPTFSDWSISHAPQRTFNAPHQHICHCNVRRPLSTPGREEYRVKITDNTTTNSCWRFRARVHRSNAHQLWCKLITISRPSLHPPSTNLFEYKTINKSIKNSVIWICDGICSDDCYHLDLLTTLTFDR